MISVLVFSTGGISGGNLNPAVTVSLTVTRKMSLLRCCCYVVAQCLGAVAGAAFTWSLSPSLFDDAGGAINIVNRSSPYITTWTAVGGEMLGTALLVFTICAAADVGREKDNKYVGALTPLNIGFAVLAAHLALLNVDGCSINPARSFGTAVVSRVWTDHWVFWVGPLVGGPVTAIIYELVFKAGRDEDDGAGGAAAEGSVGGGGQPPVATSAGSSVGAPSPAMGPAAGGPLEHGSSNASLLTGRSGGGGGVGGVGYASHHGSGELPPDYSLATASSLSLPPPTPPQRGGFTYPGSPGGQPRALLVGQQLGAGGTAREPVTSTASAGGDGGVGSLRSRGGRVAMAMGGAGGSNANLLAAAGGGEVVANPLQHPIFSAAGGAPPPSSTGIGAAAGSSSAASYGFPPPPPAASSSAAAAEPPNAFSPSSQGDWR
jgi:aquaporin PIP